MGEVDFDYEDGRMVYELEFYASGAEYEYDIDASTGAVVKFSQEGTAPDQPSAGERRGLRECFLRRGERDGPVRGRRHCHGHRQRGRPGRRPEPRRDLPGSGL